MEFPIERLFPRSFEAFQFAKRAVHWAPLLVAMAAFLALVVPSQSREIYLSLVHDHDIQRGLFALAAILLLSTTLFAWNAKLVGTDIDRLYHDHARLTIDHRLKDLRGFKAIACAALPWAGVLLGLLLVRLDVLRARSHLYWSEWIIGQIGLDNPRLVQDMENLPHQIVMAFLVVVGAALVQMVVLRLILERRGLVSMVDRSSWIIGAIVLAFPLLGSFKPTLPVDVARALGPLCSGALALIAGLCILRVLLQIGQLLLGILMTFVVDWSARLGGFKLVAVLAVSALAAVYVTAIWLEVAPTTLMWGAQGLALGVVIFIVSMSQLPFGKKLRMVLAILLLAHISMGPSLFDVPPTALVVLLAQITLFWIATVVVDETEWPDGIKLTAVVTVAALGTVTSIACSIPNTVAEAGGAAMPQGRRSPGAKLQIRKSFEDWLEQRDIRHAGRAGANGDRKAEGQARNTAYPVYLVAAQGGGIYAAASAMDFLSAMQDTCPHFAQHTFAISAVSGGAIGASIFQSMTQGELSNGPSTCNPINRRGLLSKASMKIGGDDHLSPLVLGFPYDWLMKIMPWRTDSRATALLESFVSSYESQTRPRTAARLSRPFINHWSTRMRNPALILNTTSAETGLRVAYSPLPLAGLGDGTLLSFNDLFDRLTLAKQAETEINEMSVLDAAITSARFPGVLPAWPLLHWGRKGQADLARRLNFVDGGYADASAATTAVELFKTLQDYLATDGALLNRQVQLHLILITNSDTRTEIEDAHGSGFRDIVAPVTALFTVRGLLAGLGVTRAEQALNKEEILKVELDHRIFPLPLGWKLSATSRQLITTMIGAPQLCPGPDIETTEVEILNARRLGVPLFQDLVRRNSCTQMVIVEQLSARR